MLVASGQQFKDWSADYRLFEKKRFCIEKLFKPVRNYVMSQLDEKQPLTVFIDDTRVKKKGRKILALPGQEIH
jgi:SRSO17 transposase